MRLKVFHEDEWREYPAKTYSEYTYEWLGERDASVSVRLDGDGNETARNYAINPAAEVGRGWLSNNSALNSRELVSITDHPLGLQSAFKYMNIGGGNNYLASVYNVGDSGSLGDLPGYKAQGTWVKSSVPAYVAATGDDLSANVWTYITRDIHTWPSMGVIPHNLDDLDHGEVWLTGAVVAVADSESAARAQVETYFDGDTEPDRAWVNFQPRNISGIKRIWPRSTTPPPAGTHYAWLGEPNNSPSIKYVDGVEVARNLYPDPSFRSGSFIHNTMMPGAARRELSSEWSLSGGQSIKHESRYDSTGSAYLDIFRSSWAADGIYNWLPENMRGRWLGVSIALHKTDDTDQRFALGRLWLFSPNALHISQFGAGTQRLKVAFQIPLTGGFHARLYHYGPRDSPPIYWDELSLSVADTEAEALAQVSDYFDGDTESDRAHDLWYNQDGVPHEWVNGQGWVEL